MRSNFRGAIAFSPSICHGSITTSTMWATYSWARMMETKHFIQFFLIDDGFSFSSALHTQTQFQAGDGGPPRAFPTAFCQVTARAGHFRYFFYFFNKKKWFLTFFIKLIWLGLGFLNRTGVKICCQLDKKCTRIIFYYWKYSKIPKVPSSEF